MSIFKKLAHQIIFATKEKKMIPIYQTVDKNKEFSGKIALVIGGTGGIGKAIAKALLASGASVIVVGSHQESVAKTLNELADYKTQLKGQIFDLTNYVDYKNQIQRSIDMFGRIDILICSAGVHTENVDFWKMTETEYSRVMDLNLKSEYFLCQSVAKYMREQKVQGHILLITSTRGLEPAWSPYGLSKWGGNGLVKGLAKLLAPYNITVNGIAPGSTATPLLGLKPGDNIWAADNTMERYVMPSEVAEVAKLLVSDAGRMITGNIVAISGGRGTFDIR